MRYQGQAIGLNIDGVKGFHNMAAALNPRQLAQLEAMGITYWALRNNKSIHSLEPISGATCLVLLPDKPLSKIDPSYKIFTGMIQVLGLPAEEVAIGWVKKAAEIDKDKMVQELKLWSTVSLLLMGESMAKAFFSKEENFDIVRESEQHLPGCSTFIQATYHPEELQVAPTNKAKAYRDLLNLKEKIAKMRPQ